MINLEAKWQKIWEQEKAFIANENSIKPKYYILEMLPYPSGKIHVGHLRNYTIGDSIARFMKAKGYNVLHPMGWDAFGLPAENAAITNGYHPEDWTYKNISIMKRQLQAIGFSYDWSRELSTCHPEYYKYGQDFFLKLLKNDLAYQKESLVNWDPIDNTVLANEQVINGMGWRSGAPIEKKYLKQWFLRITKYADELLDNIPNLIGWPQSVKSMQTKWIGKIEGIKFILKIKDSNQMIEAFASTPEIIFSTNFLLIRDKLIKDFFYLDNKLYEQYKLRDDTKHIILSNIYVLHPLNEKIILPIVFVPNDFIEYEFDALFGYPGYNDQDYKIAKTLNLPINKVISTNSLPCKNYNESEILINSYFLNGLNIKEAKLKLVELIKKLGNAEYLVQYHLKDWGISRQRFWGCPIPIIYCDICGVLPANIETLPITLPKDIEFTGYGNPLNNHATWKHLLCYQCNAKAIRETDTFDTFFESSWYFMRYCNTKSENMIDKKACDYWLPVDQYIGGIEHAIMHLLYARFFTKVMREEKMLSIDEPFSKLLTQGMVLHNTFKDKSNNWLYPDEVIKQNKNWFKKINGEEVQIGRMEKMSKSKKNLVDLESILKRYSADSIRLFVLSDTPPEKDFEWTIDGLDSCSKFINRLIAMYQKILIIKNEDKDFKKTNDQSLIKFTQYCIKEITLQIQEYKLNKAIAKTRELFNLLSQTLIQNNVSLNVIKESFKVLIQLLNPFIPHVTEEIWEQLGNNKRLYETPWPKYDNTMLIEKTYTIGIQINGKFKTSYEFTNDISNDTITDVVLNLEQIKKNLKNKKPKKIIIIPKKVINILCDL